MKKLFIAIPVVMMMVSCGGGCNTSTAEGAVDCYCGLYSEAKEAEGDEEKMKELGERAEAWETEIEAHFDAGDYSEDDMDKALEARDDDCRKGM